jgi:DNA-binding winged helix-turn-helix (wHTH) protein
MNLAFAGHEIDQHRRELRRAGQIVHVEPQVYDLLLHLL